jgi:2-keto-4-pentenoate hydratase
MAHLAERLWEARKQGSVVRLEDIAAPVSTEEAYAIQSEIVRLSGHEVRNGPERGRGEGARALDPMNVMVWLANQQSGFGRGLKAGDIVSTGTCTGLDRVKPGDQVAADFGSLGRVEIVLE